MRRLILFWAFMILAPAHADAAPADVASVIKAAADHCLAPIKDKVDPAERATEKGLLEFAPDQAAKFSPQGGRVFALPDLEGNAVLVVPTGLKETCGIAIRQVQAIGLWAQIEKTFGKDFALMREKREETREVTRRDYRADIKGQRILLLVSAADGPRAGGMQALLTFAHTRD